MVRLWIAWCAEGHAVVKSQMRESERAMNTRCACTVVECATGTDRQGSTVSKSGNESPLLPIIFRLYFRHPRLARCALHSLDMPPRTSDVARPEFIDHPINGPRMASASPLAHQQREFHTRTHTHFTHALYADRRSPCLQYALAPLSLVRLIH